ncbi:MAG: hypothetical protein DHS20C17_11190 [Cyclobacteriaceae bacterium]|nr:MAG: hypothetical protein DHS20C17_11190 [Cyclobacteriaceae bacterium]
MRCIISLCALLAIVSIAACTDPGRIYERNIDFEHNLWLADSVAEFEFEIAKTEPLYNLYYNVRNSISYPYHNLYVQHTLEDSTGNVLLKALQNMDLFDPTTGKPLGKGLGDIFDHRILAISSYKFTKPGWYRFKIQQFMRQDSLPLILSVGLRVETMEADVTSD